MQSVRPYQMRRLGVVMRGDPANPEEALGVLNPGAARARDGRLYLFPRVVAEGNFSRIGIAEVIFDAAGDPIGVERRGYALEPRESWERNRRTAGCEDARVVFVGPLGLHVMSYTAYGPLGPRVALAVSEDLLSWRRLGPVRFAFSLESGVDFDLYDNKDAMIFPSLVRDPRGEPSLALIHRPGNEQGGGVVLPSGVDEPRASIWISYCSPGSVAGNLDNLLHWRDHQLLAVPRESWEKLKIGAGAPPILTDRGWLLVYHGVSGRLVEGADHQPDVRYCAGALVLDADDPRRVIYRSPDPILEPETSEEREGVVPNVVFPTGIDVREGGRVDVYYGAADAAIGVARLDLPK
jgi:beta-1,2-mannobiose phosphorylase / 1,2-beta-oligomannan phosphorylase